ncbi:hypothetical protein BDFB_014795, partial [Asbolus verrucosus]
RNGRKVEGEWQYSVSDCLEEFRNEFSNLAVDENSFRCTLRRVVQVFRDTGSVGRKEGTGLTTKRTPEFTENVRQIEPRTSLRVLSQLTGVSIGTWQKIVKKNLHLFPYRLTCVQELFEVDYPRGITFCRWFLQNFHDDLLDKTFFIDEAWFYLNEYVNSQNMRMWDVAKLNNFYVEQPLHPQKIGTLTCERYRDEILTPFIEQLDDEELRHDYFHQNGARAHSAGDSIQMLREFFDD